MADLTSIKLRANNKLKEEYFGDLSKITKGAGVTLSGNMAGKALLFFYTIFLAKVLGTGDLGIYFLGITIVRLLTILANLGLGAGVVRYLCCNYYVTQPGIGGFDVFGRRFYYHFYIS